MRVMKEWYLPILVSFTDLLIDELVIKTDNSGILLCIGIDHPAWPGPINGAQAHGTRFTTGIYITIRQLKATQSPAGVPDCHHLGMGRRIITDGHFVTPFAD